MIGRRKRVTCLMLRIGNLHSYSKDGTIYATTDAIVRHIVIFQLPKKKGAFIINDVGLFILMFKLWNRFSA
jgi:hypothetical protein